MIPSEGDIAGTYGVSIGTVRRALGELVKNGYLERRPRHGTFVTNHRPHHDLKMFYQYFRLHTADDELVHSKAHDLSLEFREATPTEVQMLQLPEANTQVAYVERTRNVDGQPVMFDRVVVPLHRYPDFPSELPLPELMYRYYEDRLGIRIASVRERLAAVSANARDANVLGVHEGSPLLEIELVARDQRRQIVEMRWSRADSSGFRYVNEVR